MPIEKFFSNYVRPVRVGVWSAYAQTTLAVDSNQKGTGLRFVAPESGLLTRFALLVTGKTGSPSGSLSAKLCSLSGAAQPNYGSPLASATAPGPANGPKWVEFVLATPVVAGARYFICADHPGANGSNYWTFATGGGAAHVDSNWTLRSHTTTNLWSGAGTDLNTNAPCLFTINGKNYGTPYNNVEADANDALPRGVIFDNPPVSLKLCAIESGNYSTAYNGGTLKVFYGNSIPNQTPFHQQTMFNDGFGNAPVGTFVNNGNIWIPENTKTRIVVQTAGAIASTVPGRVICDDFAGLAGLADIQVFQKYAYHTISNADGSAWIDTPGKFPRFVVQVCDMTLMARGRPAWGRPAYSRPGS